MFETNQHNVTAAPISSLVPEEVALTPYRDAVAIEAPDEASTETPEIAEAVDPELDDMFSPIVVSPSPTQDYFFILAIMIELGQWVKNEKKSHFYQGKLLLKLNRELAKPGTGDWLKTLAKVRAQFGISESTAYRRMHFYRNVVLGNIDIADYGYRLFHAENDYFVEEMMPDNRDKEKAEADAKAAAQAKKAADLAKRVNPDGPKTKPVPKPKIIFTELDEKRSKVVSRALKTWKVRRGEKEVNQVLADFIIEQAFRYDAKDKATPVAPDEVSVEQTPADTAVVTVKPKRRLLLDDDDDQPTASMTEVTNA